MLTLQQPLDGGQAAKPWTVAQGSSTPGSETPQWQVSLGPKKARLQEETRKNCKQPKNRPITGEIQKVIREEKKATRTRSIVFLKKGLKENRNDKSRKKRVHQFGIYSAFMQQLKQL